MMYFREFPAAPEVTWTNLQESVRRFNDKITKVDQEKKIIHIERDLTINDLYRLSLNPPGSLRDVGSAEIVLKVEPKPDGGSVVRAGALIYAYEYRRTFAAGTPLFSSDPRSTTYDGYYSREPQEEMVPICLESNGGLELEYLGYSPQEARQIGKTREIQDEFHKIRDSYAPKLR